MKKKTFFILLSMLFLTNCTANEKEVCGIYGERQFTEALKTKLNNLNFSYKLDNRGFVCVKESKVNELKQIVDVVDRYYRGLATILTNEKNEEKVLSWLNKEKIPYRTQPHKKGTFLIIFSMTEELANKNKFKLDELLHSF